MRRHRPTRRSPACRRTQAGSGSGIYKMASSLGAAFGVAISAAIFTALSAEPRRTHVEGVITFQGRQDNLAIREAAIIALMFNVFMAVVAIMRSCSPSPRGRRSVEPPARLESGGGLKSKCKLFTDEA